MRCVLKSGYFVCPCDRELIWFNQLETLENNTGEVYFYVGYPDKTLNLFILVYVVHYLYLSNYVQPCQVIVYSVDCRIVKVERWLAEFYVE